MHNAGMDKGYIAVTASPGRGTVTRLTNTHRHTKTKAEVVRAREARRGLKPRHERFAHLKRMYD